MEDRFGREDLRHTWKVRCEGSGSRCAIGESRKRRGGENDHFQQLGLGDRNLERPAMNRGVGEKENPVGESRWAWCSGKVGWNL